MKADFQNRIIGNFPAEIHGKGALTDSGFFRHHGFWAPGIRLFRNLRFASKALIISLAFMLPMIFLAADLIYEQNRQAEAQRLSALKQHVEIAYGVLEWAHQQERAGKVDAAAAQNMAKEAIARLRYDQDEYFWINDMTPRVIMHPTNPKLEGQDVSGMQDPNGLPMFKAFVDKVKAGKQGFVSYQWPEQGSNQPQDKVSYVKGFEPWGWVIGSGLYMHDLQAEALRNWRWAAIITLLVMSVAGYLFLCFFKVMSGGLKETSRHLKAMTSGDMTSTPVPWGTDEAAELMLDLQAMQESLRHMVLRVRRSSDEIVHASKEIAAGAMDLSARTEQTAANIEESAASMEEISSNVNSSTENIGRASEEARRSAAIAAEGGRVMGDVVKTMDEIRSSSARIGEIISTIDGIAFQTNILALNAAVEAARAGEQGRGFAVVAGEVRALAKRSADAAREIKGLISTSIDQVRTGTEVVHKAGAAIDQIVSSSENVDQLLEEVSVGAREQNQGIAQIGQAIHEFDRMTQQNAALVEETAAASGSMSEQAQALAAEVARFILPEGLMLEEVTHAESAEDFNFDQAIDAHRQWKVRLRQAISEHARLDAETICRDDRCVLGRWLYGEGGQRWGSRPTFRNLLERHAEFHQEAGKVARQINAGMYEDAERLIGSGSRFAGVSTEVSTLLTQAKRGL